MRLAAVIAVEEVKIEASAMTPKRKISAPNSSLGRSRQRRPFPTLESSVTLLRYI
jgi:hypothetical protein